MIYHDITRYVQPGWSLERQEQGEDVFNFKLSNPGGKFTDSTISDYLEVSEDFPIVLTRDERIYYRGLVFRPPMSDSSSGTTVSIKSTSHLYILKKEDVVRRYNNVDFATVEDVLYDIIYTSTSLNSYYGITYTKPEVGDRHKLLRNFIFNNRDARSCIGEMVEYHNLRINMTVDTDGADVISLARGIVKNKLLAIAQTLDDTNTLNMDRERGSDIFFNRVKVVGRDEGGSVFVAEQQDLDSIKADGLRVRPTEDMGAAASQLIVQRYAEYLIGKYSKDNYTTKVRLDPTKLDEDELWALEPLDVVKVTNTRVGVGTDTKLKISSVSITGNTDEMTAISLELNHVWRNVYHMMFDEMPSVYDDDQNQEDEELIESRLMTAMVDVSGAWNINDGGDNWFPTTNLADGGRPGLTDMGKMLIKTNWIRDPEYSAMEVPADPLTMRMSIIYPLKVDGSIQGYGSWEEHADGFENEVGSGAAGDDYSSDFVGEYNITALNDFNIYGLLACSRYGGSLIKFEAEQAGYGYYLRSVIVDDPQFLKTNMLLYLNASEWGPSAGLRISDVNYDTGEVTLLNGILSSSVLEGPVYWYCDCYPIAEYLFESAYAASDTDDLQLRYNLRFTNQNNTYAPNNLSVVTKLGLNSIVNRLRHDLFKVVPDNTVQNWPTPTYMSIGLNDGSAPTTAVDDDDSALNHEVARTTYLDTVMTDITTVSDSAKLTAKFTNVEIPSQIARSQLSASATAGDGEIFVDDSDGFVVGDQIFFSNSGGASWTYTEASLRPNFVEVVGGYVESESGYHIKLRHDLSGAGSIVADTWVTTGKIKTKVLKPVAEVGIWNKEATEHTDIGYFFGKQTGDETYTSTVVTDEEGTDSGMGFGDFQYDHLNTEDTLDKLADTPPYYIGPEATNTFDYLKGIKGFGMTTVPLSGMKSGKLDSPITYSTETAFGRSPPLGDVLRQFGRDVSGLSAASKISPLSVSSSSLTRHSGRKDKTSWKPSKWRFYKGEKPRSEKSFLFSNEFVTYENFFASELYVFNVDDEIGRSDLKDFHLVWRGAGKSHDGSDYRDGVYFYVWHHGDYQKEYQQNDDGVYEVLSRVGDARTYFPHWDYIQMVDGSGVEVDSTVTGSYNKFNILNSRLDAGNDNTDGVNRAGYYLSEDNKIYVLAITKYKGDYTNKRMSALHTDYVGMSLSTSNILDGQEIQFLEGVDFLYDPDWDFIAWPSLDLDWNGATYDSAYNLEFIGNVAKEDAAGTYALHTTIERNIVNNNDILIVEHTDLQTREAVIAKATYEGGWRLVALQSQLVNTYPMGSRIYKHFYSNGPINSSILGTKAKTNYPARTFATQPLVTTEGLTALLQIHRTQPQPIIPTDFDGAFRADDIICLQRLPVTSKMMAGYEWDTNITTGSITLSGGVARSSYADGGGSYSYNADDKTVVGMVRYSVPELNTGLALSVGIDNVVWEDGDAAGDKWISQNSKWGLYQYQFLEGLIKSGSTTLRTDRDPLSSVGSGYALWNSYGGPGVKIEYYDRDNGYVWVTEAIDMPLISFGDSQTDSDAEIRDNTYKGANDIFLRTTYSGDLGFYRGSSDGIARGYTAYGNNLTGSGYKSIPLKVARNGMITINNDPGSNNRYCQLAIAESISFSGWEDDDWELKPKYRALHSGTDEDKKTCIELDIEDEIEFFLDAPFFDHEGSSTYDYHDALSGNVVFIVDVLDLDDANVSDTFNNSQDAGDEEFVMYTGPGSLLKVHDLVLIREGEKQEIVQVTGISTDTISITPPLANDYSAAATIDADFDSAGDARVARLVIIASQIYKPITVDSRLSLSARVFRGGRYEMVYAEETGALLVYSILDDSTIHRTVSPELSDTVQIIQEVKFNYLEKDMV